MNLNTTVYSKNKEKKTNAKVQKGVLLKPTLLKIENSWNQNFR